MNSMKCAVMCCMILAMAAQAQDRFTSDITGTVRDAQFGEALPFANVMIRGTRWGAATNTDGYFVLVNVLYTDTI